MLSARRELTRMPFSARPMAGSSTSARDLVPQLSKAVAIPRRVPGTPTAIPLVDRTPKGWPTNMSGVAAAGAVSLASITKVFFSFAR